MIDREDGNAEHLFDRAAAALRVPARGDDRARQRVVQAIRAQSRRQRAASRFPLLPWWMAVAAAIVAFVVGLGTGRVSKPVATTALTAIDRSDSTKRSVEFVFVAPTARNVSLVGDFNGWDAAATPMRRTDGRTTWSVAVQLPAGRHVYAFVVDGDAWVADPQAPIAPEQWFGQRHSVVVVAPTDRRS